MKRNSITILVIILTFVFAPYFAFYNMIPNRDSGVFLYIGREILNGKIPYLNVWDHKGPIIYYINALGVFLGDNSAYGVLIIEGLVIILSFYIAYLLLRKRFGIKASTISIILCIFTLNFTLNGGNMTEEYALLAQFIAIYLFNVEEKNNRFSILLREYLIGVTLGFVIFLRPNLIAIHTAIYICFLYNGIKKRNILLFLKQAVMGLLGAVSIILPIGIYFESKGALKELVDQFFYYNLVYSNGTITDKMNSACWGLIITGITGLSAVALLGVVIFSINTYKNKMQDCREAELVYLAIIGMPISLILSSLSGRVYQHYYISLIPFMAILAAYSVEKSISIFELNKGTSIFKRELYKVVCLICVIFGVVSGIFSSAENYLFIHVKTPSDEIVEYINKTTKPSDYVLMWGAETSINFSTNRRSPTRYVYQYPLYTVGYQTPDMYDSLIHDIKNNNTKLIIDTSSTNTNIPSISGRIVEGNSKDTAQNYVQLAKINEVRKYINENYKEEIKFGNGWICYSKINRIAFRNGGTTIDHAKER